MAQERKVDFTAVGRVARRVDLRDIRLVDLNAKVLNAESTGAFAANTDFQTTHETKPGILRVNCGFSFAMSSVDGPVAEVKATYRISYALKGSETIADSDLAEFASANGVYHSWPFLRQLVFDFTARFGFAPFTLPVLLFNPAVKQAPAKAVEPVAAEAAEAGRP